MSAWISAMWPEWTLLLGTLVVLLLGLGCRSSATIFKLVCLLLLLCLGGVLHSFSIPMVTLWSHMWVHDALSSLLKWVTLMLTLGTLVFVQEDVAKQTDAVLEYYVLLLLSLLGAWTMISANTLLVGYLGLELMSLPLYALMALRRDVVTSGEAALKYFIMGSVASALLLFGISLMFGLGIPAYFSDGQFHAYAAAKPWGLSLALVFMVSGLAFKLALVPFHMWLPDVYRGAPLSAALWLVAVPKIATIALLYRVVLGLLPIPSGLLVDWVPMLWWLALASIAVGNLLAMSQHDLRRLLGYSSIANMGYVLLGWVAGTAEGYTASLFYIITYSLTVMAAFGSLVWLNRGERVFETIDDVRGLSQYAPWVAAMWLLLAFSMVGLPPLVGFMGKLLVFKSLFDQGFIYTGIYALLWTIVGAYYYIKIIKAMYFEAPDEAGCDHMGGAAQVNLGLSAMGLLLLGLFPATLWQLCHVPFMI